MSPVIYNYCVQYHAFANKYKEADLKTKHKDVPIKDSKKALKHRKIANNNVQEMNFVSRQCRYMVDKKNKSNGIDRRDHFPFIHFIYLSRVIHSVIKEKLIYNVPCLKNLC